MWRTHAAAPRQILDDTAIWLAGLNQGCVRLNRPSSITVGAASRAAECAKAAVNARVATCRTGLIGRLYWAGGVGDVIKFVLVLLGVVFITGIVLGMYIGAAGASAAKSIGHASERRRHRRLDASTAAISARPQQKLPRPVPKRRVAATPPSTPRSAGQSTRAWGTHTPRSNAAPSPAQAAPSTQSAPLRAPKQTGFATQPPVSNFALVCECPHCGVLDTHDLRAPVRPAAPEAEPDGTIGPATPEKSWWNTITSWFDDDAKPDDSNSTTGAASTPPASDHPDAAVIRTCRSCEHVWAQKEPA
jgi:hypothetical protein